MRVVLLVIHSEYLIVAVWKLLKEAKTCVSSSLAQVPSALRLTGIQSYFYFHHWTHFKLFTNRTSQLELRNTSMR